MNLWTDLVEISFAVKYRLSTLRENYTEVVLEHLNWSKMKLDFFVNKNFHSGVLTYLWERDVRVEVV